MKRFAMIGVILCLQSAAPAMQSTPAPTSYWPSKDTYVKSDQPTASFGTSVYLSVEEDPALLVTERLYIQFSAPDLAGKTVVSAKLRLWVIRENGGGGATDNFEICGVASPWNDSLTWNQSQMLTVGSVIATVPVKDYGATNDVSPSKPEEFDITTLVQSWAAGAANEGLLIRLGPGGKTDMRFASADSVERPELIVAFGSGTPPAPPAPPAPPPPPAAPRTSKVGGEDNPCGCGGTSPDFGAVVIALGLALILATRRAVP